MKSLRNTKVSPLDPELILEDYYADCIHPNYEHRIDEFGGKYSADGNVFIGIENRGTTLKSYHIADGTKVIMQHSFDETTSIELLTIPSSIQLIQSGMNMGQISDIVMLTDTYFCRDGVIYSADGKNVVSYYGSFDYYSIESGVERILETAFFLCKAKEIDIPDTVKHIGDFAFSHCYNLKSLRIKGIEYDCRTSQLSNDFNNLLTI